MPAQFPASGELLAARACASILSRSTLAMSVMPQTGQVPGLSKVNLSQSSPHGGETYMASVPRANALRSNAKQPAHTIADAPDFMNVLRVNFELILSFSNLMSD